MKLIMRPTAFTVIALTVIVNLVGCSGTSKETGAGGTVEDSATIAGSTSQFQDTGYVSLGTQTRNFENLVETADLPGALPYSLLSEDDLGWFLEAGLPVTISEWKGYRFANGDVVVLFRTAAPMNGELLEAQDEALFEVAREQYPAKEVWANPTYQYIVVASDKERMHRFGGMASQAGVGGGVLTPR